MNKSAYRMGSGIRLAKASRSYKHVSDSWYIDRGVHEFDVELFIESINRLK